MSKSSVQRHQQAIERRDQYPESAWWETEAGSAWLKLLVVGSLFFFGIKHGIGVGELSQFLKAMRLGLHVGCSPSTLDKLKQALKETIAADEVAQAEHCQPQEGQGICVGADEVFFGKTSPGASGAGQWLCVNRSAMGGQKLRDLERADSALVESSRVAVSVHGQ